MHSRSDNLGYHKQAATPPTGQHNLKTSVHHDWTSHDPGPTIRNNIRIIISDAQKFWEAQQRLYEQSHLLILHTFQNGSDQNDLDSVLRNHREVLLNQRKSRKKVEKEEKAKNKGSMRQITCDLTIWRLNDQMTLRYLLSGFQHLLLTISFPTWAKSDLPSR